MQGKRLAGAHLIFNMATALIAIVFIYQIRAGVDVIAAVVGIADDDYTLKLAVFHTIFNTIGIVVMVPFINKLVSFLTRTMPEKTVAMAAPKYLNDSVAELPDTAIEAVRKETLHLYDNAFEIIAHGLSLHRHEILSDQPLDGLVKKQKKPLDIDIDELYQRNVKGLYSDIVHFTSRVQPNLTPDQSEELFAMRAAGRDIVEAIKGTKHMHKNLVTYIVSDNESIREEYNNIRIQLGKVMRRLAEARRRSDDDDVVSMLSLDTIKLEMEENDTTVNGVLERLIREGKISADMATSLMNDVAYAYDVAKSLVQMGEVLFATGDLAMKEAERSLSLDEDDVDEMLQAAK